MRGKLILVFGFAVVDRDFEVGLWFGSTQLKACILWKDGVSFPLPSDLLRHSTDCKFLRGFQDIERRGEAIVFPPGFV